MCTERAIDSGAAGQQCQAQNGRGGSLNVLGHIVYAIHCGGAYEDDTDTDLDDDVDSTPSCIHQTDRLEYLNYFN